MVFIEGILILSAVLYALYKYGTVNHGFFKKNGIEFKKPWPYIGSYPEVLLRKTSFFHSLLKSCLETFKDKKIFGIYSGRVPFIIVKDLELIKQVTVKDFDHFVNHQVFFEPEDEPLFGNSLFGLKDQKWKDMRSTLSPAFTGSKMRLMFHLISECCDQAVNAVSKKLETNPNGVDLDVKDLFTRYTNDVIASSAFGIKINSIGGENSEFYEMGKKVTSFTLLDHLKMLLLNFKFITRFLKIKMFDPVLSGYFVNLVMGTMKYRAENNISRPDMINMLMEAKKTSTRQWTDEEIVAQCFLFFFAGFETTSYLMCFAAQELMENQDVQNKLFEEIQTVKKNLNGQQLTYEALQGMKYMDMILSEILRKWPVSLLTDRVCTKNCVLKSEDFEIEVKTGTVIGIPIVGLHRDPELFPDPDKFDPERFNDENKGNIKPFSYCPFGLGPRICIGSRLALMESKAVLFYLLSNFKFEVGEKTKLPMEMEPHPFQVKPKDGFWIKITQRKN